jgi:nuclear transport factor 2 (NTF2) superfamily protein
MNKTAVAKELVAVSKMLADLGKPSLMSFARENAIEKMTIAWDACDSARNGLQAAMRASGKDESNIRDEAEVVRKLENMCYALGSMKRDVARFVGK